MENIFLNKIRQKVEKWRKEDCKGAESETKTILSHIKRVGFLHEPQIEALETYIYLKEIAGNKPNTEVFKSFYSDDGEMLLGLGIPKYKAFDLIGNTAKINELIAEKFGELDYPNQVYALTMGAGKTILMGVMIAYDFTLSYYHPEDKRFAKNALVFAPDKTIIESLKEIKSFDYAKVLPKEYLNYTLNIKYHYLENVATALTPIGNYNIIVSNSQKIILKTRHNGNNGKQRLLNDFIYQEKREIENKRLQAIRQLNDMIIFVDEAHHSYGTTLEGALKKTRQTVNYIHKEGETPVVSVINLTGTPYVKNQMIGDVVYHFGLKQGIEKGILKQVRFSKYTNVRSEKFIEDVISKFWGEYGENRLEGKLPKIAFYSASIADLQSELRPALEKVLLNGGIPLDKVLEYHTEAEDNRDDFIVLDFPESKKQFILLVGKGTEGWNCRSLVSCALFRKPKSAIFTLQSSTRCLRSIGDNSTLAHIFLSSDNYKILDNELKNNFAMTIKELEAQEPETIEHTLQVEKTKKIKVKKELKEIVSVQNVEPDKIKIDISEVDTGATIATGGIFLDDDRQARYKEAQVKGLIQEQADFTIYNIIETINRNTHLDCLFIETALKNSGELIEISRRVNQSVSLLSQIIREILSQAFKYEEKREVVEEELELTKSYPFKISVQQGKDKLVVYKEKWDKAHGKSRIGFHINPYNFDSSDEKDIFKYLRHDLQPNEAIADVYFTGGVTDETHNDFYFEYYSPEKQRIAKYFPDFLIETSQGRFLVVEVKGSDARLTYEQNKKTFTGKAEDLFDEVFAKELGFDDFRKINKEFEYHIIFNTSLQKHQQELFEKIKSLES